MQLFLFVIIYIGLSRFTANIFEIYSAYYHPRLNTIFLTCDSDIYLLVDTNKILVIT